MPNPFPIDDSRTRWVTPITPAMLAKIEAAARRDRLTPADYGAPLAWRIVTIGCLALATVLFAALVLA